MIIDCISDLHGHYPKLEGGDLLIVAGDLTARDDFRGWLNFVSWLQLAKYRKKIVIGGNHDGWFVNNPPDENTFGGDCSYLKDSGTTFEYFDDRFPEEDEGFFPSGKRVLKIWGSPWTLAFEGMNPRCKAFTVYTEEELAAKWALIPDDIDILITHSPPAGLGDKTARGEHVGSKTLLDALERIKPQIHIFGHVHEGYGSHELLLEDLEVRDGKINKINERSIKCYNASYVDERYRPVNKPIRVIL